MKVPTLPYRGDIDGLRAVAVIAVVVYHVFPRWLPGGFCGVDVFFVISGFLITRQLNQRDISFASFYTRRLRRLAPALLCVLLATVIAGMLFLLPNELSTLGLACFAGATFLSNFFSWQTQGYFDRASSLQPLLHLWSLGVEEQFYLFWPALIALSRRKAFSLTQTALATGLASFVIGLGCAFFSPAADFYLPFSRIWEFMIGAVLALGECRLGKLSIRQRATYNGGGLLCLLISVFQLRQDWFFPSPSALFPVLGAALVIAAGPETLLARRILSSTPARWLGSISYPLYLWHWPLIAYEHLIHGVSHTHRSTGYAIIALSVTLATLTTRFVEAPLRWKTPERRTIIGLLTALTITAALGLTLWAWPGYSTAMGSDTPGINLEKINLAEQNGIFPITTHMRVEHMQGLTVGIIGSGPQNSILFTGDSLLFQWAPRVDALFAKGLLKRTIIFISGPSCAPLPVETPAKSFTYCNAMSEVQDHILTKWPVQTIVMGALWERVFDPRSEWPTKKIRAEERIKALSDNGKRRIVFIMPTPTSIRFDPAHMVTRHFTHLTLDKDALQNGIPLAPLMAEHADMAAFLASMARDTGSSTLDLTQNICGSAETCFPLMPDGTPKFADQMHLRPDFTSGFISGLDDILTKSAP
ncbi:acyltransferase family protein [Acetobacter sp.]|jgi:peptidoglycan/LPS O-acetylase OafA/YrhL|uniref:acyltransferase family protein n=1 Tax=Acetobacter sp. TaxID=440 RepID=UPI0025BD5A1B|nr:acyltransferase [Acetobacter sp.]MCH4091975.1 acyltransferase [Acetobacter sp.]MCI1301105.1 acyltransferase [Acetobacter sp.]MCI1317298.1 acyltransferase [Acetobacter sp.]